MKVLFVHHSGLLGGAGVSLLNVADVLCENGHEVTLCIPSEPYDMLRIAEEKGLVCRVSERRIGAITYVSGIDAAFSLRFLYRIFLIVMQCSKWNRVIKEYSPDLVAVNSKTLCWMSMLPEIKKRKSICFVRETIRGSRKNILNRVIAFLLDQFKHVSFISEYDRHVEQLKKAHTMVINDNFAYYAEPDPHILEKNVEKWNLHPERFRVLYLGGVSKLKGFHIATQAILSMGKDVDLIVAGNDFDDIAQLGNKSAVAYSNTMKEYIQKNDLNHQIHLVGKQENISYCYELCDAVIFPMQSPHQARPVFEAGYFCKPIVISDFENIYEFVQEGKNGLIAKADCADEFVKKLLMLKNNPELRKQIGLANRENAMKRHSPEAIQAQIAEMMDGF